MVCCIIDATNYGFEVRDGGMQKEEVSGECLLHHNGMWKEEVSERMFVASLMQHTRISRLEMFLERCCITVECGRKRLAASVRCIVDAVRDVASRWNAEGGRGASECLLHC